MDNRRAEVQIDYLRKALSLNFEVFDEELYQLCHDYSGKHNTAFLSLQRAKSRLEMSRDEFRLMPLSQRMSYVLENPLVTTPGRILLSIQFFLVMASVTSFVLETVPAYNPIVFPDNAHMFFIAESLLTAYFTIETILRFVVVKNKVKWLRHFANIMDIVSVLPFYLELIWSASSFLVVFRIVRLTRVIKMMRNLDAINNLINALKRSARALVAPLVFLTGCVLVLSSIVFYSERGEFDETLKNFMIEDCACNSQAAFYLNMTVCPKIVSKFTSIPATMWWGIVTMTTVGYGDLVPQCQIGKFFGTCAMILGILNISMPIAIVGSYFTVVINEHNTQRRRIVELIALRHKQDRKRVEELARNRQLHSLETGEMRAFCMGRKLNHSGTRDDMIEQIYAHLNVTADTDPGVDARLVAPGEAMVEHLRTFMGDTVTLSDFDPVLVHHLDVFLYRLSASLLKRAMGVTLPPHNFSVCPCRLRMVKPNEIVNNTILLSRPLILTVGRRSLGVPDADIVLPVDKYAGSLDMHSVSQRHAVITIQCTPRAWVTTIRPVHPNRMNVNGVEVPQDGVQLKQGDYVNFNPTGDPLEFRFENDDFDISTLGSSLLLAQPTEKSTLPPIMMPLEREMQPITFTQRIPPVAVSAFPDQVYSPSSSPISRAVARPDMFSMKRTLTEFSPERLHLVQGGAGAHHGSTVVPVLPWYERAPQYLPYIAPR